MKPPKLNEVFTEQDNGTTPGEDEQPEVSEAVGSEKFVLVLYNAYRHDIEHVVGPYNTRQEAEQALEELGPKLRDGMIPEDCVQKIKNTNDQDLKNDLDRDE